MNSDTSHRNGPDATPAWHDLPDVVVKTHRGRPTVFIDGEPRALAGFCPFYRTEFYENYMHEALKLGFELHFVDIQWLGIPSDDGVLEPRPLSRTRFWCGDEIGSDPVVETGDDVFDVDKQAEFILAANPDAWLMVRFNHHPPNSWRQLHPSEFVVTEEGEVLDTPSFASEPYWTAAARYCSAVVRHVESRPWARRVIGYANFQLVEGLYCPVLEGWLFDHNPAMLLRWREFLAGKYGTVEKLREAHQDDGLTFHNAAIPRDKLRGAIQEVCALHYWQPAAQNQPLRDYLELVKQFWHLRFSQICKAMRGAAERNVLMVHDALKQQMLGWNHHGFFNHGAPENISWNLLWPDLMAGSGHIGVAELFNAVPGFDGLLVPYDYHARGIGGTYETEGIPDSAILRGAYFFSEMDMRVIEDERLGKHDGIGAARNEREMAAIAWRNFAGSFTRGFNSYWHHAWTMHGLGGWIFRDEARNTLRRYAEVVKESLDWDHETVPGIAMILDDSAVLETNGSGHYFNEAIMWEYKMGLARCGLPFRIYLFEDLLLDNFPEHRVFYFPNLFRVDQDRLAVLKEKVLRDGRVVVWGPGSGISDGKTIGTESATALTGFNFTMLNANVPRRVLLSNFDHPVTRGLDAALFLGGPLPYGPLLLPADGTELGVAWVKGGRNHVGLAIKEFGRGAAGACMGAEPPGPGDYAAVFTAATTIPADMWRNLARYAGAHVYTESNDIVMANKSLVALHSLQSGRKRITLPGLFRVTDVVTGQEYSPATNEIIFDHESPDTHVFLLAARPA